MISKNDMGQNGYFSLFVRKNNALHFLAAGNAAGTLEPDLVHCAGYSFMLELLPHEGRILIFDVPVLMGANRICYCTNVLFLKHFVCILLL